MVNRDSSSMKKFRYKNILLYSSHQWCGNTEEYFVRNTEKLAAFLIMPRVQNKDNLLRIYEKGTLIKEVETPLSENFFLYYLLWYFHYIIAIFRYFSRDKKLIVIITDPFAFFFMTVQKLFRNIDYVYYIADYYPPINITMKLYEKLKKFYHDRLTYRIYLGDGVNEIMNGKVMNTRTSKTIMLGVKPKHIKRDIEKAGRTILFVGVVRSGVGLEIVYEFLKANPIYNLKVIGICDKELYQKNQEMIKQYGVGSRVYFPNRFFFDDELNEISKKCFVGVALYNIDNTSTIYYADPGKVKTYTEMGLPVIMSKTSSIAPYIKKYKAGEVIDRNAQSLAKAIEKIKANYSMYIAGVNKLNKLFYYETYYEEKFKFLENVG